MTTFYLRLALLPIVLLTAVLLVIRSQPYDDHELRELLLPTDCPAPCFMGIQPGVTTVEEAVKLLEASGWVESYKPDSALPENRILITWNRNSPLWFDLDNDDERSYESSIWFADGRMSGIEIDTTLPLGTLQIIFGKPLFQRADVNNNQGRDYIWYSAAYPNNGLRILMFLNCDTPITYQSNVILSFQEVNTSPGYQNFYNTSWGDALRTRCPTNP